MTTLSRVHFGTEVAPADETQQVSSAETVQRTGVFHTWGTQSRWDEVAKQMVECTVAIAEESVTGRIYEVCPDKLTFITENNSWSLLPKKN